MIHSLSNRIVLAFLIAIYVVQPHVLHAQAVGEMPVPELDNVSVQAAAVYDTATRRYTYHYRIQNPITNSGEIWNLKLDIRTNPRFFGWLPSSSGLTIPFGISTIPFVDMLASRQPLDLEAGISIVPIGQQVPPGWHGGFGKDGYARFTCGSGGTKIAPGTTMSGFTLISYGIPTIREIQVIPDWVLIVPDHDTVTEAELEAAAEVERDLPYTTFTLGPSSLAALGSRDHWTQLATDLQHAISLGWITEASLAQTLRDQLSSARDALDQNDGTLAKARLQMLLQTIQDAPTEQRNQEILDLVVLNAQSLIDSTPDTPIPFEPVFSLTPRSVTHPIGVEHTITAKVVNSADSDAPISGYPVFVTITKGPHSPMSWSDWTDANGEFTLSYTGTKVGTDRLVWIEVASELRPPTQMRIQLASLTNDLATLLIGSQSHLGALAEAEVTWTGGPDLVVPFFMPPEIISQGGSPVFVTEITENIGVLDAAESPTRYYLSPDLPLHQHTSRVIGERRVETLLPGQSSESGTIQLTLPSDLPGGTYYLAACADADDEVVELDEDNNCSFSELITSTAKITPALEPDNLPPDCSEARLSKDILWPPNHRLVDVTIMGVTDPDGDPVSIEITSIRQDEPVNRLGDGDTSPDGFGIGTSTARIRAERSGLHNGRVYHIGFIAHDGQGGTCEASVTVGVPHDLGNQSVPIDDGPNYDSTLP